MTVHSGKHGNVFYDPGQGAVAAQAVYNWSITEVSTPFDYAHSSGKAGRGRNPGTYDFTGSFQGFGTLPPILPGSFFNFEGYSAPDNGVLGAAGRVIKSATNVTAGHPLQSRKGCIVEDVSIEWDYTRGGLISWTINFAQANGVLLVASDEIQQDTTTPTLTRVCSTTVKHTDVNTTWPNILSATLNLMSNNQPYVNSSTNCATARERGIVDATCDIVEQNTKPLFALGTYQDILLYTGAAAYYYLHDFLLTSISDFRVDINSGALIQFTNNFAMAAVNETDGSNSYIALPGEVEGTAWWPVTYNS